jgi:hypothetical protein
LSPLLILRLPFVATALLLSLPPLLIFFPTTATTFRLRLLRRCLITLLPSFFSLLLTVFAVARLLRSRDTTGPSQRHCTDGRRQGEATEITALHNCLLEGMC